MKNIVTKKINSYKNTTKSPSFHLRTIVCSGALLALIMLNGCATKEEGPEEFKHLTAKQILVAGEKELSKNNPKEAVKHFEAIDALYPFDPEVQQSQIDTVYAYYKADEAEQALAAADRYIQLYPQGEHTDYAYYMKGIINFDKSNHTWFQKLRPAGMEQRDITPLQRAFVNFGDLIKNFPNSLYVRDAYERMRHIRSIVAQHEINIAQYYLDRKAYVAAANRASYVVKHITGTPQTLDALKIMIKAYHALGATKQEEDARQILHLNYPNEQV
jgi:outer membrane protein assembly factor BamD